MLSQRVGVGLAQDLLGKEPEGAVRTSWGVIRMYHVGLLMAAKTPLSRTLLVEERLHMWEQGA